MLHSTKRNTESLNIMAALGALSCYVLMFMVLPSLGFAADGEYSNVGDMLKSTNSQMRGAGEQNSISLISAIFYIMGIALIGKGLMNAKRQSEGGQGSGLSGWLPIFGPLVIGALLIALPSFVDLVRNSIGIDPDGGVEGSDLKASRASCSTTQGGTGADFDDTIGGAICRVYNQTAIGQGSILAITGFISFLVGLLVVGSALMGAYRLSTGGQGAPKISGIVWRCIGGALLMTFPAALALVRASLFEDPLSSANFVFSKFTVVTEGEGLDSALTAFVDNIKNPVISITFFIFIATGVILIARTLYAMSGINFEQQRMTTTQIISRLLIGGCLASSWSIYTTVATTVMGGTPDAVQATLAYSNEALDQVTADRVHNIMNAAMAWVQIVGMIAFFRGFLVLKASLDGQGNGGISAGMTHIIAGTLCINIPWTILMIQNTIPGIEILNPP